MSKYNVGDKFIVEISEVSLNGKRYTLNRGDGAYALEIVDEWELDRLSRAEKTYEDGLADAWGAARKIYCNESEGGLPKADMNAIFGNGWHVADILKSTPQEAIAKIKEWEDSKEIKRGDEVMMISTEFKGIVVSIEHGICQTVWKQGVCGAFTAESLNKTGRNFADKLDALLTEIGGTDNVEKV